MATARVDDQMSLGKTLRCHARARERTESIVLAGDNQGRCGNALEHVVCGGRSHRSIIPQALSTRPDRQDTSQDRSYPVLLLGTRAFDVLNGRSENRLDHRIAEEVR